MRFRSLIAAELAAVLMLAACGSSSTTPTSSSSGPSKVDSIASEVPASILALAPLQLVTDGQGNAPGEYIDPATGAIVGSDVELGNELCKVMGVVCTWNNVTFDDIIAQLKGSTPDEIANGDKPRYVFSIAGMTPRLARENAGIDFITYFKAGEVWMELAGGPPINSAVDMCGRRLATTAGTIQESDAWGFMGESVGGTPIPGDKNNCKAAGKPDITVLSFPSEPQADATLLSGRADIVWTDQGIVDWVVKGSNGKLKAAGPACTVGRYGIAVAKGSPLEKAITDALKYLIDNNDYYINIFKKWGNADGAIASSDVALNDNSTVGPSCVPKY